MIVAVAAEKGGTGKSTLAVHLAGWAVRSGRSTVLVDADPQGTASMWADARSERNLDAPPSVARFSRGLRRCLLDQYAQYDDVVVDIGAGDGEGIRTAMQTAELVIVPVQPNAWDVWTVELLDELAEQATEVNDDLTVKAVLNRASPHSAGRDVPAAQEALKGFAFVEDSGLVIKERAVVRRAVPYGLLVDEYKPRDRKATAELASVYQLVYGEYPTEKAELKEIG